jgi:hypothetical protein
VANSAAECGVTKETLTAEAEVHRTMALLAGDIGKANMRDVSLTMRRRPPAGGRGPRTHHVRFAPGSRPNTKVVDTFERDAARRAYI